MRCITSLYSMNVYYLEDPIAVGLTNYEAPTCAIPNLDQLFSCFVNTFLGLKEW